MRIRDYIADLLRERLAAAECLVLYDPEGRYREVALGLAGERCAVVDASVGTIQGREQAMQAWLALGREGPGARQLVVYVPAAKPLTEDAQQRDPFQAFGLGGDAFPRGEGDAYLSLCLQAKPEQQEQVYGLFQGGAEPSFETVDALDTGSTWPKLRTFLGAESPREIVIGLLSPTEAQRRKIAGDRTWLGEYRKCVAEVLGLQAHAKVGSWDDAREELARFVLFSELVFDLPGELPPALAGVPRADPTRRTLVYAVCEGLRDTGRCQEDYIALANAVSRQLDLPARMAETSELGVRDTFLFEERAFLRRCAVAAAKGDLDTARVIVEQRRRSIWAQAEERGAAWVIAERSLDLLTAVGDLEGELDRVPKAMAPLVTFYVDRARRADTLHRNLERTVHDAYGQTEGLEKLIDSARGRHRAFVDRMQKRFVEALHGEGWPVSGFARHTRVFQEHVAPALEQNRKVAFFLVDALRYELAAELAQRLPEGVKASLHPALAQVPTITPVGMAALLPGADGKLELAREGADLVPLVNGQRVSTPAERVAYVQALYGDRCAALDLEDLLKTRRPKLKETVDLLIIKSTDIDTAGENMAGGALGIMRGVLEKLLRATRVLQELGFQRAVLAADHGFVLLSEQLPGDKVEKPRGSWTLAKVRCVGGAGGAAPGVACFRKEDLGLRGDLEHLAVPESLGAFKTGATFMHSGLSLQECIIPVLTIELGVPGKGARPTPQLQLQYRGGKTDRITTRRPMIEVVLFQPDMFGAEALQFSLEARAGKKVVGDVAPNPSVDPATGLVAVEPGAALKVPLRMDEAFEGEFTVTATDPVTQITYATLKLQTDYVD